MKLTFFDDFTPGALKGERIVDIGALIPLPASCPPQARMEWLIANWAEHRGAVERHVAAAEGVSLGEVRLRAPLPRPSKILCAAANYMEGIAGNVSELEFFHKSPSAVIGDGDTLELPDAELVIVHHELELGVVIGKAARNVGEAEAMDHVFGYTIIQDGSARGVFSKNNYSWFSQKSWDTLAPLGPVIATADEIADPHDLQVRLWSNGELRQDYSTSDMAHRIPTLIRRASQVNTLLPGDIIACGCNRQGLGPLQHGDTVVQEISGIGQLTTHVTDPRGRQWPHGIDVEFAEYVKKPRAERGLPQPPRILPAADVMASRARAATAN
jgi:2-keto-4-pentenoate hydratase/2-oxohepta-3-ene-1,7-dioic acid hydratase in catechol pathway